MDNELLALNSVAGRRNILRSLPILMAAGLGGLDLATGQRRGFKDPLETHGGFVVGFFGSGGAGPFESSVSFFGWAHA
jgi:hypothetical protein